MSSDPALPFKASASDRAAQLAKTARLASAAAKSVDAGTTAAAPITVGGFALRPLARSEIATLEGPKCRCRCDDWSNVRIMTSKTVADASDALARQVTDTTFGGWVVLGVNVGEASDSPEKKGTEGGGLGGRGISMLDPGVKANSLVANCILEPGCRLYGNTIVSDTHVCAGASIVDCGSVTLASDSFGDAMEINIGPESGGGRAVSVQVESTLVDVCRRMGMSRMASPTTSSSIKEQKIPMNVVCPNATIAHTPTISSVYLSPNSTISSATSVKRAVLLPQSKITSGVTAEGVFLQWDASITTSSSVESTLLMEHSHVGPNSLVASTILGPDSHVSAGEVHCTLLGPNTNSHHQSLVISILWPLGRGNVGYGSNIGSNHTGRLPDQETAAGEGTFWGLASIIKFPVDLTGSPYGVVAAGVSLPPQRVSMPFCLITAGNGAGGDGLNQIAPGWVLQSSPYTISRSEAKFANRRKAKRHGYYTGWDIIRPSVVDMCIRAREALRTAARAEEKSSGQGTAEAAGIYKTDRAVAGIGLNYLTERSRIVGIRAYTDTICRYALTGLLLKVERAVEACHNSFGDGVAGQELERRLNGVLRMESAEEATVAADVNDGDAVVWPLLPWEDKLDKHSLWNHQRSVLRMEIPFLLGCTGPAAEKMSPSVLVTRLLQKLVEVEKDYAKRVFKSKMRDDERGKKTIPCYDTSHVKAEEDGVVKGAQKNALRVEVNVRIITDKLVLAQKDSMSRL